MKKDWKKDEKILYLPKGDVYGLTVGAMNFLTLKGEGSPQSEPFKRAVKTLFTLSYTLKFGVRKGLSIEGYQDYSVYPLEGVWDLRDEAKAHISFTPEDFIYTLMIRQPDFFTQEHLAWAMAQAKKKDPDLAYPGVRLVTLTEGDCIQTLHTGPFATESMSFARLESYLDKNGLKRKSGAHREIYLSDFTRTAPEALRTVLRIQVEKI